MKRVATFPALSAMFEVEDYAHVPFTSPSK